MGLSCRGTDTRTLSPFFLQRYTASTMIQNRLRALRALVLKHKRISVAVAVVLLGAGWFFFGQGKGTDEQVVEAHVGPFVQEVSMSGKVTPAHDVAMSFEHTGRVGQIYVAVGDTVRAGQVLASLDIGTLAADLASAEAEADLKRIEIENQKSNLKRVTEQQDTLVASARRNLLTDDLAAVPTNSNDSLTAPEITGAYVGDAEGVYRMKVVALSVGRVGYDLRTFGIETTGPTRIPDDEPAALGTQGLFVSFPDGVEAYADTMWDIAVPNKKGASYRDNYNAYQEALRERERSITEAEKELSGNATGTTIAAAQLKRAEADVARIRTEIAERTLRAPFDGTVTAIDIEKGGAVSISDPAVSVISNGALEVESFVPEINISYLSVGDKARVTLDAYGDTVPFEAVVVAIDPAETVRDGVSTYRVRLAFLSNDERVRPGMTANIVVVTDERDAVLTVPQGAVTTKSGKRYVRVAGDTAERREVVTGAISSLGEIEIISGLSAGESVLVK